MRALITCGPTWVAIDAMRVISNRSTGEMGRLIAACFRKIKVKVTLLEGPMSFDEFAKKFKAECVKKYDIVVHAAAVSDFKPKSASKGKLGSDQALNLRLVPTEKLVNAVKRLSPGTFLVGFKLESNLARAVKEAKGLFTDAGCDLVVANSMARGYQGCVIDADGNVLVKAANKKNLAETLARILLKKDLSLRSR